MDILNRIEPFSDIEINDLLKKYNCQLKRNLKTLAYLSAMEINKGEDKSTDVTNLKRNVQRDIIRLTEKINRYSALL